MQNKKLMMILHNVNLQQAHTLLAPLFQATVAAAMEYEVEVILSGKNYELAMGETAHHIFPLVDNHKSLYDCLCEAVAAGVALKVCSPPSGLTKNDMIPEIQELVGGAYLISEAMDPDTVTFTY